jgi:hypothetical protein
VPRINFIEKQTFHLFFISIAGGVLGGDVHQPVPRGVRQRPRHEVQRHVRAEDVQGGGQGAERTYLLPQLLGHCRALLTRQLRGQAQADIPFPHTFSRAFLKNQ